MNAEEEEEEEEEETQRKRRALINGFSSSFEGRRDDIAKRVELFRRDTEEEEEEEEEEHHHNNREFTNALREALRDVPSTMNKREEDKKEENCLTSLSSKKSIATQTERNVKRIMNKRLERVKKMTDYVAVASWGGGGKSFSVEDDDTRRLCHDARMMMEEKKKRLKPGSAASTRRITKPLKDWMYENVHHPYPSRKEKMVLSQATGMSPGQISNWCINFRGRKMRPLVREFVEEARKVVQQ
jgi:hypothetical protein